MPARPHGTYSIVARDPATGEVGAAVQSHWFSVGSLCTWARPGVGAVATQSVVEPAHGPAALDRLAAGDDAATALAGVLSQDGLARVRQVGVVGARGGVAVHTGPDCIAEAGDAARPALDLPGEHDGPRDGARTRWRPPSTGAQGDLAERLMTALEGAEAEGGDVRGRQSAALLVAPAAGEPWRARVDLRVEDHADPVGELRRLLGLQRAYELAGEGDELAAAGDAEAAAGRYVRAAELAPESDELLFWAGLAIAQQGDVAAGADAVRRAASVHPGWLTLLERLSAGVRAGRRGGAPAARRLAPAAVLHVGPADQPERADADDRRAGRRRIALALDVVAADQREAAQLDRDALDGAMTSPPADQRDDRQLRVVVLERRLAQVEVGTADQRDPDPAPRDAPAALAVGAADQRDAPAPGGPRRRRGGPRGQVRGQRLQLAGGRRAVGPADAVAELLERQPSLAARGPQPVGHGLALRVRDAGLRRAPPRASGRPAGPSG